MLCDICGQGNARIRHISRSYGKGETLLVIENVPVISCPDCGESYLTAETLHQIDRIKRDRKTLTQERPVEVATFV
ncbi:type II toxin-antitoxin system MqsA family antitoxin [Leptolyngbya sp. GGD]|uniref:type II toxin-antitoxin system MqsA family antitoxin n=1 Tax=Leptolyngbya sp. GGD TaxID=2997907 RepID=UPI00227B399E|nr:type II toxin-antitoxin system MqsA family antitoxin [Leptolyngbya sp. GGD]MCY6490980.1 type II toxin-antitoxin system MqsA family antitoxin [Leptolyngbya sp. GGD]